MMLVSDIFFVFFGVQKARYRCRCMCRPVNGWDSSLDDSILVVIDEPEGKNMEERFLEARGRSLSVTTWLFLTPLRLGCDSC